jgi:hypothetical protein
MLQAGDLTKVRVVAFNQDFHLTLNILNPVCSLRDMLYFALQVRTGKETQYIDIARFRHTEAILLWPRRRLRIRNAGRWRDSLAPLFPGYLFLKANRLEEVPWSQLRGLPDFIRFLP